MTVLHPEHLGGSAERPQLGQNRAPAARAAPHELQSALFTLVDVTDVAAMTPRVVPHRRQFS